MSAIKENLKIESGLRVKLFLYKKAKYLSTSIYDLMIS